MWLPAQAGQQWVTDRQKDNHEIITAYAGDTKAKHYEQHVDQYYFF